MRVERLLLVAAIAAVAACDEDPRITGAPACPALSISDGGHGGDSRFHFLPPLVQLMPDVEGEFDPNVDAEVRICSLPGCAEDVAAFTRASSPPVRVDEAGQHYSVAWTPAGGSAGGGYRLRVLAGERLLGWADLDILGREEGCGPVDVSHFVGIEDGRPLSVRFRIERGLVGSVSLSRDSTLLSAGEEARLTAEVSDLHDQPLADRQPTWSSSDTLVARVDADGTVRAVGPGRATIFADVEGARDSSEVVVAAPVVGVCPAARVEDGTGGGLPGFHFLPPLVAAAPAETGGFDPGVSATVRVCALPGCAEDIAVLAASPEGEGGEAYSAVWDTEGLAAGTSYRLRVVVEGYRLGSLDVDLLASGEGCATTDRQGRAALPAGEPLPVRFRLEEAIPFEVRVTPGAVAAVPGSTANLYARARYLRSATGGSRDIAWTSDRADVATVDDTGFVVGRAPGTARVVADVGGLKDTTFVVVTSRRLQLAFTTNDFSADMEVYSGTLTGYSDAPTRLTSNAVPDEDPAWSPSGSRIAFIRRRGAAADALADLWVMDADGGSQTRVAEDVRPTLWATPSGGLGGPSFRATPTWSPDGSRIAFLKDSDVYVVNSDGTGARNLTDSPASYEGPGWSPDGGTIAFLKDGDLYTVRPDGSDLRRLTSGGPAGVPRWSGSGERLAFDSGGEIYVMNADGSALRNVTSHPAPDHSPDWSPAGDRIAFVSTRGAAPDRPDVYVVDVDGGEAVRITHLGQSTGTRPNPVFTPRWSPEGGFVAFGYHHSGEYSFDVIGIAGVDGPRGILFDTLDEPASSRYPAWRP